MSTAGSGTARSVGLRSARHVSCTTRQLPNLDFAQFACASGSRRGKGPVAGGTHMALTKHRAGIQKVRTQQRRRRLRRVLHLSILGATVGWLPPAGALPPDARAVAGIGETYGRIAASFEVNRGQTDQRVEFLTRSKEVSVFFTPAEVLLAL